MVQHDTRRKHSVLAACFFCHLQDQQQAQGHQQLFIRALPEEEDEDGQQQQVPGIHTAQVKLVQQGGGGALSQWGGCCPPPDGGCSG